MIYRDYSNFFLLQSIEQSRIDFNKRKITDPILIKKYDDEFNYNFYTPNIEHDWLDTDIIIEHRYSESKKLLGTELLPIFVAVNDKDENIDDPVLRIHGRLLDGRQRYEDSKTAKQRWSVVYVYIENYDEFITLLPAMGSLKSKETIAAQTKAIVRATCERVWKQKPKEIFDKEGIPRKEKVSAVVKERLSKHWSVATIGTYIPPIYKEQYRIDNAEKRETTPKKISKIKQENKRLKDENNKLIEKNAELETRVLPNQKKDALIKRNEAKINQLKTAVGTVKSELRKIRKELKIDKTDEDFDTYWDSLGVMKGMYTE